MPGNPHAPFDGGELVRPAPYPTRSEQGKDHYRHRKFIVEPVFGQTKQARGLRQFLLRGFGKVQAEWKLWSLTHNLRKLHLARVA